MFDELASIFFFSSAGGDADSYRAAATKPGTPAGSPSPARAAAGGSRCGSASQGFPRPALSSTQLTFGIQFVFPTRMIPKIGITSFSGKSSIIIEGKYEKSLTKHLEEAGLAVREVIACDRRILGFHWLDKDRIK